MVFSSIFFLFYFMPVFIVLYYIAPRKAKNSILLLGSLFFYAWGEPVYVLLMAFSIVINYLFGLIIGKAGAKSLFLALGVIINLALLGIFKYATFFISNVNSVFGLNFAVPEILLPIGISFYTFQALSYLIDLYRGEVKVQKNIIDFGAYISMFPQLIAGPIVRLKDVEDRLAEREHTLTGFAYGVRRFVIGLGKKVLLANNAGMIFETIKAGGNLSELSVLSAWIMTVAFTFQIYFDFSGYSDMAIGLGSMIGFRFPENFNYPYISKSVTEFWRRWHISLGTWFREYVYIPLGGNRKGMARQIVNLTVVWLLTGLWHGASWNFVMWGAYYGLLLIFEKLVGLSIMRKLPSWAAHIITLVIVVIGWTIFSLETPAEILSVIGCMFGMGGRLVDPSGLYILMSNKLLLVIMAVGSTDIPARLWCELRAKISGREQAGTAETALENLFILVILVISIAYITAGTYNPFLYFRF